MGFFQGVAKAVGEISEENFTRRENQKARDLQVKRDEEGRKHDFALLEKRIAADQQSLIAKMRASRAAASSTATDYTSAIEALNQQIPDGTEGKAEYMAAVKANPSAAQEILNTISDRQDDLDRALTPQEIVNGIRVVGGTGKATEIPEGLSELEREYFIEAQLEAAEKSEPALYISGELYANLDAGEMDLANETVTVELLSRARMAAKSYPEGSVEQNNLIQILNKENPDTNDMRFLVETVGGKVFEQVLMENRPELIRNLEKSAPYRQGLQSAKKTILDAYEEASPEDKRALKAKYPGAFF